MSSERPYLSEWEIRGLAKAIDIHHWLFQASLEALADEQPPGHLASLSSRESSEPERQTFNLAL